MKRIQLRYGEMVAVHIAQHNSLVQVVTAALGGTEDKPKPMQLSPDIETAIAQVNNLLNFG